MQRRQRRGIAAEAHRRWVERRARIGGQIRAVRRRRRWTQGELAQRAGIGRSVVSRAERGEGVLDLETLERIAVALDVPLVLDLGRDRREDLADAGHLGMQELVLRVARAAGWAADVELATRPAEPGRSVDVGLADERQRRAVVVECWNSMGDFGAAARSSTRKQAELEQLAVARWGAEATAGLVWVVRATAKNRALVERYPEVFAARFKGSSALWVRALTEGGEPPAEPGLIWCDPGSTRLFAWRRPPSGS